MTIWQWRGYLFAHVLSAPIATWTLLLHPERVSMIALLTSVLLNSALWAILINWLIRWVRNRMKSRTINGRA